LLGALGRTRLPGRLTCTHMRQRTLECTSCGQTAKSLKTLASAHQAARLVDAHHGVGRKLRLQRQHQHLARPVHVPHLRQAAPCWPRLCTNNSHTLYSQFCGCLLSANLSTNCLNRYITIAPIDRKVSRQLPLHPLSPSLVSNSKNTGDRVHALTKLQVQVAIECTALLLTAMYIGMKAAPLLFPRLRQ
jgi:hypothetical protein